MWSWTKLSSAKWEDAWSERIAGNPNAVIEKLKGHKSIRVTVYTETQEDAVTLRDYFGGSIREVKTRDWISTQAQANRPPLRIRNKLIITEQTEPKAIEQLRKQFPGREILSVPAEMAFGTGDHATTSTCLRLICDFAKQRCGQNWTMTDIGCGTAVLALAAIKMGAEHATAFDFDSIAVDVAKNNASRNLENTEKLELFHGDVFEWKPAPNQTGDLVAANLFSTILQKAFPTIILAMKPDARLIISGILASQWEETRTAAEKQCLSFIQTIRKGKWVTALARLTADK